MRMQPTAADELLTPAEVAAILFVDPKTVTRWARAGKLDAIRTPGGHRRYLRSDVLAIMTGEHHSQQPDRPGVPAAVEAPRGEHVSTVVSEAVANALEAEADEAVQVAIATAAAAAEAAQKAAAATAKARQARAYAAADAARIGSGGEDATEARQPVKVIQVPAQRDPADHDGTPGH
jgi:excisionase family DNA binding protein